MASFSRSWNDDEDDNDDDVPFSWRNVRLARIRAAQLSPGLRASRPRLGAGMATRLVTSPLSRRSRRENREQFGDKCMLGEREGCGSFRSMAKVGQVDAADFPRYFLWSEWKEREEKERGNTMYFLEVFRIDRGIDYDFSSRFTKRFVFEFVRRI